MNPVTGAVSKGDTGAAAVAKGKRITIDPITRLEGHGKIDIFLDDKGDVERAYLQVPELRGFEVFSLGRPAEDMPQITSRICGVCPTAHHMAATKALDDLYKVEPTPAGAGRSASWSTTPSCSRTTPCTSTSWAGPDFIVGPEAPAGEAQHRGRDRKVGVEVGKKVISMRRRAARADRLLRRQGDPSRCSACPAACRKGLGAGRPAEVQGTGQGRRRVRPVHARRCSRRSSSRTRTT